jgi:GNAT superfamily N-acetyltransferase
MEKFNLVWASSHEDWAKAAQFFARIVSMDPAYISHGEMQTALSIDGKTWAPDLEKRFLAELGEFDGSRSIALLHNANGELVGAANVTWSFETAEAPFATLEDMAIDPSLRHLGLGAKMLSIVEQEAVRRGAKWIFLESGKDNHKAHAFFERNGFAELSHVFVKPCSQKS